MGQRSSRVRLSVSANVSRSRYVCCVCVCVCVSRAHRSPVRAAAQAELLDNLQQEDQQRAQHLQERELKLNPHVQGKGALACTPLRMPAAPCAGRFDGGARGAASA